MDGGTLGAGAAGADGAAPRSWPLAVPGILGVLSVVAFVVVDLGGLILTAWGPHPGSGWLKANFAVSIALLAVTVAALVLGLSAPGIRRAAIVAAWLVIPVGWAFFLVTCQLARKAG